MVKFSTIMRAALPAHERNDGCDGLLFDVPQRMGGFFRPR
jgi:hypothetical protein